MTPKVHDRLAADLPINAIVSPVIVDDPYEAGAQITVLRSLRDDALARLACRGHIDRQLVLAGRAWQADYELVEIGNLRGIDTTRDAVDGGRFPDLDTDRRCAASDRIARDDKALGQEGAILIRRVLVSGMTFEQIGAERGDIGQFMIKYLGRRFREALETLAQIRGFVSGGRPNTGP